MSMNSDHELIGRVKDADFQLFFLPKRLVIIILQLNFESTTNIKLIVLSTSVANCSVSAQLKFKLGEKKKNKYQRKYDTLTFDHYTTTSLS